MHQTNNGSLVSIITPSYNSERFISATIESVLAQTYQNWEMIIADDCSTDRTLAIVEQYARADQRIKHINLGKNSGPAIARNSAIEQASGRYLAFLDDDDIWLPEKLEKQVQFMQDHQIAFSFTKYAQMTEDGTVMNTRLAIPDDVNYEQLLKHNVIGCLTVMLDTSMIGPVRMVNLRSRQDFVTWLALCKQGYTAYGLQEILAQYRIVSTSVSSNKFKMAKQMWKVYRQIEQLSLPKSMWCFLHYAYFSIRKLLKV